MVFPSFVSARDTMRLNPTSTFALFGVVVCTQSVTRFLFFFVLVPPSFVCLACTHLRSCLFFVCALGVVPTS